MTRVLIVESAGNLWGSERSLLDLLGGLSSDDVTVCCPGNRPLGVELERRGVRTLPYYVYGLHEKTRWHRLWAAVGVLRACLESKPDVIHLNQAGAYKVALPAATLLGIPMVAHLRLFEDAAYLARQRPIPRRVSALVAISGAVESEVRRHSGLASIPVYRAYDSYVRSAIGGTTTPDLANTHRVACVGRLVPIKGQDILIRSLKLLRRSPDSALQCLFIGEGDPSFVASLRELAARDGVAGSIVWQGFVSEVVPLLRSCAVLACPSHREPLGRVIFEAWDAGAIPVVFEGNGGAAEIVRAADAGMVYPEQSPESLAEGIQAALALSVDERAAMIARGREWMSTNCDPKQYGATISGILRRAMQAQQ